MISVTNDILSITLYRTLTINIPFPLYRPLLGIYYPLSIVNTPSVCNNCLTKITPQDEQGVLNSKAPVSQLRFTVRRVILTPQSNPTTSESGNPSEQSPPYENPGELASCNKVCQVGEVLAKAMSAEKIFGSFSSEGFELMHTG